MSFESKSILARLLAEENLTVSVDGSAKTAYFNLKTRTITIPNWADASPELYDLLLGHEVGHARNTPEAGWHDNVAGVSAKFKAFLNVCEDARIEKKMRRKYPGLRRSFLKAYAELAAKDFFGVQGKNLSQLLLIDRINLAAKLGSHVNLTFAGVEKEFYDRVMNTETWEEVVAVARDLYEYCKEEKQEKAKQDENGDDLVDSDESDEFEQEEVSQDADSEEFSDESDDESDENEDDIEGEDEEGEESRGQPEAADEETDEEPESVTDEAFRANEEKLATLGEVVVLKTPSNILNSVFPVSQFLKLFDERNEGFFEKNAAYITKLNTEFGEKNRNAIDQYVKEFQSRKSAAQWRKARTADTGDIDATRLARYRMTDEIFKARAVLPKGKNHGMVMLIDLSSSMRGIFERCIEHTLVLATLCKRVGIPFVVYGFTDNRGERYSNFREENKANDIVMPGRVVELLNSDQKSSEYKKTFSWLLVYARTVSMLNNYDYLNNEPNCEIPHFYHMGSTPTTTAMAAMTHILPAYRAKHNLEKLSLIYLTDGIADTISVYEGRHEDDPNTAREYYISGSSMRVNSNYGKTYFLQIGKEKPQRLYSTALVKNYVEYIRNVLNVDVFGFYLASKSQIRRRDHYQLMSMAIDKNGYSFGQIALEAWKKEGYFECYFDGCTRFWVINPDEGKVVEVESGMTSNRKAKAFASANRTKKLNRIIATKFMELAA